MQRAALTSIVAALMLVVGPVASSSALASEESVDAAFSTPGGNEWWIEVYVDADEPLERVDARINHGDWIQLEHKDWGTWATSTHVPDGSTVEFQATSTGGETITSQAYQWPSGELADDSSSSALDAAFSTSGGNEWWIEVYVDANERLAKVDARIDGGQWQSLEHKDWGSWAQSYHAPEGSHVEFRATSSDDDTVLSPTYRWTGGEEIVDTIDDVNPATMDAAFGPKAGNAWWVEVYVVTNGSIQSVEASVDGGDWHELTYRDWGAWAASFHVPDGSEVTFRATDDEGAIDKSQPYHWPEASPADDPDAAWPTQGNYADYHAHGGGPTSAYKYEMEALYVHGEDGWVVRCEGYREDPGGREEVFDFQRLAPPEGPSDVWVGKHVDVEQGPCHRGTYDNLTVQEQRSYDTRQNGQETSVSVWFANRTADCRCQGWEAHWETETNLVTEWWRGGRTGDVGELQDTDAPMSEG